MPYPVETALTPKALQVRKIDIGMRIVDEEIFSDGWLRTGDLGHFDTDGYLFITGRLKEIVNRGGEKISPAVVEQVLLEHPAIAQAIPGARA